MPHKKIPSLHSSVAAIKRSANKPDRVRHLHLRHIRSFQVFVQEQEMGNWQHLELVARDAKCLGKKKEGTVRQILGDPPNSPKMGEPPLRGCKLVTLPSTRVHVSCPFSFSNSKALQKPKEHTRALCSSEQALKHLFIRALLTELFL